MKAHKSPTKRHVGIQTIIQTKEYFPPQVSVTHNLESVEFPRLLAISHNICYLVLIIAFIYFLGLRSTGNFEYDLKMGLLGMALCTIVFGSIYFPDSVMRRPHPVFWRFVTSCAILYLSVLVIIFYQTPDNARSFLAFFDKNLGKPLPERNYAENCDIIINEYPFVKLDVVYESADFYLTVHLLGWFMKTLIIRDVKMCWFLSILFEVMELTFRHWLPNFYECWWDHLIFDIFGMNAIGIWVGSLVCKYFEMKNYSWVGSKEDTKMKRVFGSFFKYFVPNYWVKHEWHIFQSVKRFYSVLWFIIFTILCDLSNFFLKYILWIPANHFFLQIRVFIWAFLSMNSSREYYEFITNDSCKRFGFNAWLAHLLLFFEWAIVFKCSRGVFTSPFPTHVVIFWGIVLMIIVGITILLGINDIKNYLQTRGTVKKKKINMLEPEIEVEEVTTEEKNTETS